MRPLIDKRNAEAAFAYLYEMTVLPLNQPFLGRG
jgi:hypothetical protein